MSDTTQTTAEEKSFLGMTDDEIKNFDPSALDTPEAATTEGGEAATETEEQPTETTQAVAPEGDASDDADDADTDVSAAAEDTTAPAATLPESTDNPAETAQAESTAPVIDYKAEYDRLTAPFKANGKDMAITNVDDAITLMKMGANYNKKMAALKPNLKLMKLLENNNLLDEGKLSYLIDLDKKSPEAISKLIKDSGMDPLDLDAEKAGAYVPNTHRVDDREIELDTVLDSIQDTPTYTRTLDIVSSKWDAVSKQAVANKPELLKVINDHVASGIYDVIHKEMERERMLGRLNGLSDIDAYRTLGDAIQARGGFANLGHQRQQPNAPVVVPAKPKTAVDDKLRDKKRAASLTKPAGPTVAREFNPLAMSDEEFSRTVKDKYL